jgi:hypothetical protein
MELLSYGLTDRAQLRAAGDDCRAHAHGTPAAVNVPPMAAPRRRQRRTLRRHCPRSGDLAERLTHHIDTHEDGDGAD